MALVKIGGFASQARGRSSRNTLRNPAAAQEEASRPFFELSEFATQEAQRQRVRADNNKAVEAQGQYQLRTEQRVSELNPTSSTYSDDVVKIHEEEREATLQSANFALTENADRLDLWMRSQAQAGQLTAVRVQKQKLDEFSITQLQQMAKQFGDQVRTDPEAYEAYEKQFMAQANDIGADLSVEQQSLLLQQFRKDGATAQTDGWIESRDFKTARSVIEENSSLFSSQERRALLSRVKQAETRTGTERQAAISREVADVETAIIRADNPGDLAALERRVDQMHEDGLFDDKPNDRPKLIRQIRSRQKSLVDIDRHDNSAMKQFASGVGLDTQAQADSVMKYSRSADENGSELVGMERDRETAALGRRIAIQGGVVPTDLENFLKRGNRSTEPDVMALAAMTMRDVEVKAPNALKAPNIGDVTRLDTVNALARTGQFTLDEAAQIVSNSATVDRQTIVERDEQWSILNDGKGGQFDKRNWRTELEDEMGGALVTSNMVDDFRRTHQAVFRQYADVSDLSTSNDVATNVAIQSIQRRYAPSDLGGNVALQHAPENHLPIAQATGDLFEKDPVRAIGMVQDAVRDEIREGLALQEVELAKDLGDAGWRLRSDAQTQEDIERGRQPSYPIEVARQIDPENAPGFVVYEPLTDDAGQPIRYTLPNKEEVQANKSFMSEVAKNEKEEAERIEARKKANAEEVAEEQARQAEYEYWISQGKTPINASRLTNINAAQRKFDAFIDGLINASPAPGSGPRGANRPGRAKVPFGRAGS